MQGTQLELTANNGAHTNERFAGKGVAACARALPGTAGPRRDGHAKFDADQFDDYRLLGAQVGGDVVALMDALGW